MVKSPELVTERERLSQRKIELQKENWWSQPRDLTAELVQTLRIRARSNKRFTNEQKTGVFRSIVKEAHLTALGVEMEMYVQPAQNIWFKYRQKRKRKRVQFPIDRQYGSW